MTRVEQPFHGVPPIEASSEDRLGSGPAANHVAEAIRKMASPDGFVIGIGGEWRSGKSSFIKRVFGAGPDFSVTSLMSWRKSYCGAARIGLRKIFRAGREWQACFVHGNRIHQIPLIK